MLATTVANMTTTMLEQADIKVGDRVCFIKTWLKGWTARVATVSPDGSFFVIGDWTQETGFTRVPYGPIPRHCLKKI